MRLRGTPRSFRIFDEKDLGVVLQIKMNDLNKCIQQTDRNELLNANEPELIQYYIDTYSCDPLEINYKYVTVSEREAIREDIQFGKLINLKGQLYTFHISVAGDLDLLECIPSSRLRWSTIVHFDGKNEISFDVFGMPEDSQNVIREKDSIIDKIKQQLMNVNNQVLGYNNHVRENLKPIIQNRKKEILKQMDALLAIGMPLKKRSQVSETFSVPTVKRKPKIIDRPNTSSAAYSPEPTLDSDTYHGILGIIHDFGVEIERHPAVYEGKDEESLRDHFILVLSPQFDGGVTGETFNKVGKTDILIRYKSKNVFVAECKFWRGQKAYLEAIDQAIGYLTWRDSKAALICFIDNKELNPILEKIIEVTPTHHLYAETLKEAEGRYEYRFHLSDDPTRNVFLTILCFHFPKLKKRS